MTPHAIAESSFINVYLKLKPNNSVEHLIGEFNQFLTQEQIITQYHLRPYLPTHPLHVTLYMTHYRQEKIPLIIKEVQELAKKNKALTLVTTEFIPKNNAYVMLGVAHNPTLDALSNQYLNKLAPFRDQNASIPAWAAQDKKLRSLFSQYGSPNVGPYFNPHFSIFDADHLTATQGAALYSQLQRLAAQFNKTHPTHVQTTAYAIGVAVVDEHGQIVNELYSLALRSV